MITVNTGRTFLKALNHKTNNEISAKEFFEEEYFELFFNHPKYMQWPTNSPFVQMKKGQTPNSLRSVERKEKLHNLHVKISEGEKDASIAIGFPASEVKEFATTSGLITDMNLTYNEEEIYLSWIGSGLSLGVAGGLSILFNNPEILLKTYEGWKVYRQFLNDPTLEKLAGNKITSWNGQWLNYSYSKDYRPDFDYATLDNLGFFKHNQLDTVIETVKWSRLFFNLSRHYPNQTITGYVFGFGQMNKTIGFFPFRFHQARKLISFYQKLFGESSVLSDSRYYENMYGIRIKQACELGALGIQALEPEGLRKFFDADKMPNLSKSKVTRKKNQSDYEFEITFKNSEQKDYENNIIPFRVYKTWLLAMITKNKEEMSDYTQQIAKAIYEYRATDKKAQQNVQILLAINSLHPNQKKDFWKH